MTTTPARSHEARIAIDALRALAGPDFEISISDKHVPREGVRTAMSVSVPIPPTVDAECAWLVFIDLSPCADWAHACLYVFVDDTGKMSAQRHEQYPPTERCGVRLVKMSKFDVPAIV